MTDSERTTATSSSSSGRGAVPSSLVLAGQVVVPAAVFDAPCDLHGFRRWAHSPSFPERGRCCFLDGELNIDMSPEEIQSHNKVKTDVHGGVWLWVRELDLGELLSDGVLFIHEAANLATEPDLLFCSWESLRARRVWYEELRPGSGRQVEVRGSPDLALEIVSASSVRKDTKQLPRLYFAAGVREYWLIDARGASVKFTLYRRGKGRFVAVRPDAQGFRRSAVLGGAFRIDRERNPVGGWRYTLVSREAPRR